MWWLWVAVLAVVSVCGGGATGWPLLQHLGYALAGIDLLGFLTARSSAHGLVVSHSVQPLRITAGEQFEESYAITKTRWPAFRVEIDPPRDLETEVIVLSARSRQSRTISRRVTLPKRGCYNVSDGVVRMFDPFGLFCIERPLPELPAVTVYPRPIEVPSALAASREAVSSHRRWRMDEADATLGDLRPYAPGDPPSRIHWRSSARTGTLLVTDPETRRNRAIWLLVDISGEDSDQRAPGIAAYLSEQLCHSGHEIGAIVAGRDLMVVPPRRGRDQLTRLLEPLAVVRPSEDSQIERLAESAARCDRPDAFVVISACAQSERALGRLRRITPAVTVVPEAHSLRAAS
jgi:uncharacterized protein (DUF58 family)